MATQMGDYTELLLRRGVISLDQLSEAEKMARDTGKKVAECLVQLAYASGEEVMQAMAEHHKLDYVDLTEVSIPENIIELVPESVARENGILPMAEDEPKSLDVTVDAKGGYYVNREEVINTRIETLKRAMGKVARGDKQLPVVINADAKSPHQAVITVMDAAQQLGLLHITFAARKPGNSQ